MNLKKVSVKIKSKRNLYVTIYYFQVEKPIRGNCWDKIGAYNIHSTNITSEPWYYRVNEPEYVVIHRSLLHKQNI
jgi:hypothetical protein